MKRDLKLRCVTSHRGAGKWNKIAHRLFSAPVHTTIPTLTKPCGGCRIGANVSTPEEPAPFGALLRRHRATAGLTQADLAERAGLSARGISDLERGARKAPHPHTVRQLAAALRLGDDDTAALMAAGRRDDASGEAGSVQPTPSETPTTALRAPRLLTTRRSLVVATGLLVLAIALGDLLLLPRFEGTPQALTTPVPPP